MAFDIPVDIDYFDHPKTKKLCQLLKKPEGAIYPLRLWAWCAKYAKDGRLPADIPLIEAELGWMGTPARLHGYLMGTGFIEKDGVTVHDWMSHIGRAIAIYEAKKRKQREKYDRERGIIPEVFRKNSGSLLPTLDTLDTLDTQEGSKAPATNPQPLDSTLTTLQVALEPKPNGHTKKSRGNSTDAKAEVFRQLWEVAKQACIIGKDETLASYLRGWIAQKGADEVHRILLEPRCRGRAILDIQKWYFDGMSMKGD